MSSARRDPGVAGGDSREAAEANSQGRKPLDEMSAEFIGEDIRDRLYKYIGGILKENKSKLMAVGGMPDHIHLLVSLSKELSVAAALRLIKTNSSKWVHERFPEHRSFSWQAGYAALR